MPKIKRLAPHEAQKIAAGEVVERPVNVVKELVENALDAGATNITIYLEEGGKNLIRVVDNGCGMSEEDALLCFTQHATSKISSIDDLDSLSTFGFRGEALASIAAVSQVILVTREQKPENGALSGIKLEVHANQLVNQEIVACTPGTDISVRNLFYNIPARQKFLKKRETETRQIIQLVHAFCLDYGTIHFCLFHNDKEVLNCPATCSISTRITQLWDHTIASNMLVLEPIQQQGITLHGAFSNHHYFRYDSSNIFLFVNKRWIKNVSLSRALLRGYTNVLPTARYPIACLFIDLDQTLVDINVHPKKEEVLFLHPKTIESSVQASVKSLLENNLSAHIRQSNTMNISAIDTPSRSFDTTKCFRSFDFGSIPEPFTAPNQQLYRHHEVVLPSNNIQTQPSELTPQEQKPIIQATLAQNTLTQSQETTFQVIGQYNKTYILIEHHDGLFLVDQHAAHERILYELFSKRFHEVATVQLMFPEIIALAIDDVQLLTPFLDLFKTNGIEIEQFSERELIVQSTPVHLKNVSLPELLRQVIAWIREEEKLDTATIFTTINEKLRAQMACKAAVKAGDQLTTEEMTKLLQDLEKTTNRLTCPHGRPTGWLFNLYEIEKRFKRKM
jgi:DNA mismatch repair protein MutL